ncbi:brain chitinase, putative [Ixodes scapularis]|uniref:Brain chitinase, putative n=1 Tax=Ixodes scapularis TaxID=6945 RepID=B7PHY3_IXOSC|nr:brain chitinase, putative [Ixodes scapularis]|eukprot:XP_002403820.1 brain chitinase, putative [Ixodes scapularis]
MILRFAVLLALGAGLVAPSHVVERRAASSGTGGDLKIVCYYSNWAVYRPSLAKFTPQNINPYLCTHIIYAFAGFNKRYELKPYDPYNDVEQGMVPVSFSQMLHE